MFCKKNYRILYCNFLLVIFPIFPVMFRKINKIEKMDLVMSTLFLALLTILIINLIFILIFVSTNINDSSYEFSKITFINNYITVNGKKIGFSIFYNLGLFFLIWVIMFFHTLKIIKQRKSIYL